ncbi:MAG TPA: hypothetical protein VI278_05265 [Nitrososphaeraceae archaeon]
MSDDNNTERERKVLELYNNQGKTTREIAKEQRLSLRDIGRILKKNGVNHGIAMIHDDNNKKSLNEKSTQAYKLFSEGKSLIEVSIELGLREKEASKLFREFLKLKRQDRLHQIYPEIEPSLPSFLKLHKVLKKRGLNPGNVEWFADAIEMGTIKLPELQHEYKNLQNKVQTMQYQKQKLERDLQVIQRQIMESTEVENMHQHNVDTLQNDIEYLYNERSQLEQFVSRFKNSDRKYLEIRGIAEQIVNRLLAEQGALLTSAIMAVIQALRENPNRHDIIFDTSEIGNGLGSGCGNITSSFLSPSYPSTYQNHYSNEYLEGLLEVARVFFNVLLNNLTEKTMVAAVKGK